MLSQPGTEPNRSNYRLLGLVGQGQFGRVFCAVHRQTGQIVALKELDRQRFPTHKFLRELRFLLSLQHPNIVNYQALEHTATGRYLVMDYCHGGTLRRLMSEETRASLSQSLKLIVDILQGLDHAHSRGIVHCDIKPENILLNVHSGGWVARISDFGIARLNREGLSQEFGNTGSPAYMAPERFYGQYSPTSDLYSVGILLFELLAGYRPFSGTPSDLMSAHLNQPLHISDRIPEALHPLITTALQKLSARRFQSAKDMLAALQSIVQNADAFVELLSVDRPLLQATITQPVFPLQSQDQEPTFGCVTALAIGPQPETSVAACAVEEPIYPYLYRAELNQLHLQVPNSAIATDIAPNPTPAPQHWHLAVESQIRALFSCPRGCFVATHRSLYLATVSPVVDPNLLPNLSPDLSLHLSLQLIYRSEHDFEVAIDPNGRWIATLDLGMVQTGGELRIWQCAPTVSLTPSLPINLNVGRRSIMPPQLLALDARHIAVITDLAEGSTPSNSAPMESGSQITILTRRGTLVGTLNLPISIGTVWLTTHLYQLLAIDRCNPDTLLLIDLKPYRMIRLHVGIQPTFAIATQWGYVLGSTQGSLMFLDREGQQIGHLLAPDPITAMTFLDAYRLLIATWNGQQGCLHTLNIQESNVELLF